MLFEITMPQLGLTMEVGTVVEWLLGEGDSFAGGQEILQVETDKAIVAVEAHQAGTLARIVIPAGQEVPVGAVLAVATGPGERLPADWPAAVPPDVTASQTPAVQIPAARPDLVPHTAAAPGLQASWKARAMARQAGLDLETLSGSGPGGRVVAADVARVLEAVQKIDATPVAANLAAALGLDLAQVHGSGPGGRIGQGDVLARAAELLRIGVPGAATQAAPAQRVPQVTGTAPLKGVRKIVSEGMAHSAHSAARVTLFREANVGDLVRLRQRFQARGLDISYNDLLVRVCAIALREHPQANARLGEGQIEYLNRANIGLAVDTDRGLLVPVVHNAGALSIAQIAAERTRLVEDARTGRSRPDDLTGGTFTITNLGMLGVEGFTPIINLPECCILGVGRIVHKPVALDDGTLAARPTMTLSLAFDHRVIDGAPAARFLERVSQLVEDPMLLLAIEEMPGALG
jgi:pyruvate dehydrogenase E2 component (dihydrolipoamide acetyltransferase)